VQDRDRGHSDEARSNAGVRARSQRQLSDSPPLNVNLIRMSEAGRIAICRDHMQYDPLPLANARSVEFHIPRGPPEEDSRQFRTTQEFFDGARRQAWPAVQRAPL